MRVRDNSNKSWKKQMIDPFSSHLPIWHPKRLFFKLLTHIGELYARLKFEQSAIVYKELDFLPEIDCVSSKNSSVSGGVSDIQLKYLLKAVEETECFKDTVIVEIGAYRGGTTMCLAQKTSRKVIAVDMYHSGWKPAQSALIKFNENTSNLDNVFLERTSSISAAQNWKHGKASLVFIDGQHNYINTRADIRGWFKHVIPGGLIALHDTDIKSAGTRLAAKEAEEFLTLYAHIKNLVIFLKPKTSTNSV